MIKLWGKNEFVSVLHVKHNEKVWEGNEKIHKPIFQFALRRKQKKKSHSAFIIAAGCIESDPMNMTQFNSILYDKM
jgi:hypothetical protein